MMIVKTTDFTKMKTLLALITVKILAFWGKIVAESRNMDCKYNYCLALKKKKINYLFQRLLSIINGSTTPITKADIVSVKSRLLKRKSVKKINDNNITHRTPITCAVSMPNENSKRLGSLSIASPESSALK